jgi:uncharacterized protein YndB with AHSA1/START domain
MNATTTKSNLVIDRQMDLRAPIERVWRALTDEHELARWFPSSADIAAEQGANGWLDWGELGRYAIRVETFEPPTRLSWRWAREASTPLDGGQTTLVEWTLEPLAADRTRLVLRESGFRAPEHHRGNSEGWDEELAELRTYLEP